MTVPHFTDHAANERTFLAWVRTAIAVMAFGFLVERFDIFLKIAGKSLGKTVTMSGQVAGSLVGLALIVAGALMVMAAMLRFVRNRADIADDQTHGATSDRLDLVLAGLIVVLGVALAIYLGLTMLHGAKQG
ncbi:YidH family protein [Acidiphilium sp.]|uniref:YidH family protein n=1 Tax=Acidiphilium sp. TaxID=527 RepID=UPI003D015B9F